MYSRKAAMGHSDSTDKHSRIYKFWLFKDIIFVKLNIVVTMDKWTNGPPISPSIRPCLQKSKCGY